MTSIGSDAFSSSGLTSITIPSSVTSIGANAFGYCAGLAAINVDAANPTYASIAGVLVSKNLATLIQAPGKLSGAYVVPSSITSIGAESFESSAVASVTIPSSITGIGSLAFNYCGSLTSVYMQSATPPTVGTTIFANTGLPQKSIHVPSGALSTYQNAAGWTLYSILLTSP